MNKYIFLTFFIVSNFVNSYGQSDTLNQLDLDGKKIGWWVTYLDGNLEVLKDSSGAELCMYNYYKQNVYFDTQKCCCPNNHLGNNHRIQDISLVTFS